MKNLSARRLQLAKCLLILIFAGFYVFTKWNSSFSNFSAITVEAQTGNQSQPQTERFDELVRDDFFAGMLGDKARLDRGMKFCEEILAKNPRHAQALVWHGGGLIARAADAYRNGDNKLGDSLWNQGIKEMNDAVAFAPDRIDVKIGRSATVIGLAQAGWDANDAETRELLKSAVLDYEKVYQAQKPAFSKLWEHSRGELLFGLASGWSILGEHQKSREYLRLIVKEVKGTDYATEAQKWLDRKPAIIQHDCRGCHTNRESSY
jgi:hypothetical protein